MSHDDEARVRVLQLAVEQSKLVPAFVAYITEQGMREHLLELATSLGYECSERKKIRAPGMRNYVGLVTVGVPQLYCCMSIYVDPLVTRREEHAEFWRHVQWRRESIGRMGIPILMADEVAPWSELVR
jgi:hypothetical protein